jgi:hypothetical protein
LEAKLGKTQELQNKPKTRPDDDSTIHFPESNLPLGDAAYIPRHNWGHFQDRALIAPQQLEADFSAGLLTGWHIEMHFAEPNAESLRLALIGDAVVGRIDADVNLDYFTAAESGVSRKHAMLRFSETQLYLIDMESTNGSLLNGLQMSPSRAYPLTNRDVITFGQLTFTLYIFGHGKSDTIAPA